MRKLLVVSLLLVLLNPAVGEENPVSPLPGYIVRPVDNALELTPLTAVDANPEPLVIPVESGVWYYLALSPDEQYFALVAGNDDGELTLEVHDLRQGTVDRQSLPVIDYPDFIYRLAWTADSLKLVAHPSLLTEPVPVYDLPNRTMQSIPANFVGNLKWLPGNEQFIFEANPVCETGCRSWNDLYIGKYTAEAITITPLTRLDASALGITEEMTNHNIRVWLYIYVPQHRRFYVNIAESTDSQDGFNLLYSLDWQGNFTFEADVAVLGPEFDPDSSGNFYPQPVDVYFNPVDERLYLLVFSENPRSTTSQYIVARLTAGGTLTPIYDFEYNRIDQMYWRSVTARRLSPDGRYLALGMSGHAHLRDTQSRNGNLIIVDLTNGDAVVEEETSQQVCELFWSEDSTRVIYTQTLESPCVRLNNQPVNQLVAYNLNSRTTGVLVEDRETPFFFLTGR